MSLFDTRPLGRDAYNRPIEAPEPPPIARCNPTVAEADIPRLGKQHHAILAMLRKGSATNVELAAIGQRFGGRIHELRRAGYAIVRTQEGQGLFRYELFEVNAPEPSQ